MKLLYFEFIKLIKQKSFWFLLIAIITSNLMFLYFDIKTKDNKGLMSQYYSNIKEKLNSYSIDEAYKWLSEEQDFYLLIEEYKKSQIFNDLDNTVILNEKEKNKLNLYKNDTHYWNERTLVIEEYTNYYFKLKNYQIYLNTIIENAKQIQNGPLYSLMSKEEKDDLLYRVSEYKELKNIDLKAVSYRSIEKYCSSSFITISSIVLVCMIAVLILKEDEEKMKELLETTLRGKKPVSIIKLLTYVIISILSLLLVQITFLIMCMFLYGPTDLMANIQSLPIFYESSLNLCIYQWLIINSIYNIFSIILFGIGFIYIYKIFENKQPAFIIYFSILLIEGILYIYIPENSFFSMIKNINIFSLCSPLFLTNTAKYVYLFSLRIPIQILLFIILLIEGIIFGVLFIINSYKKIKIKINKERKPFENTNLFMQEGYRILILNKGFLIIAILFLILNISFISKSYQYNDLRKYEREKVLIYNLYEGHITKEKEKEIINKLDSMIVLKNNFQNVKKAYESNQISYSTFIEEQQIYNQNIKEYYVYEEFMNYLENDEKYIIYNKGFSAIFNLKNINQNLSYSIWIIISVILYVSCIFNRKDEAILYEIAYKGKEERKKIINIHVFLWGLLIVFFISLYSCMHYIRIYPLTDYKVSFNLLRVLDNNLPLEYLSKFNAGNYLVCLILIQILGCFSVCNISSTVFMFSKNRIIGSLTCILIFLCPVFLYYVGFESIIMISIFDLIMGNLFLQKHFSFMKIAIIIFINVIAISLRKNLFKSTLIPKFNRLVIKYVQI